MKGDLLAAARARHMAANSLHAACLAMIPNGVSAALHRAFDHITVTPADPDLARLVSDIDEKDSAQ